MTDSGTLIGIAGTIVGLGVGLLVAAYQIWLAHRYQKESERRLVELRDSIQLQVIYLANHLHFAEWGDDRPTQLMPLGEYEGEEEVPLFLLNETQVRGLIANPDYEVAWTSTTPGTRKIDRLLLSHRREGWIWRFAKHELWPGVYVLHGTQRPGEHPRKGSEKRDR